MKDSCKSMERFNAWMKPLFGFLRQSYNISALNHPFNNSPIQKPFSVAEEKTEQTMVHEPKLLVMWEASKHYGKPLPNFLAMPQALNQVSKSRDSLMHVAMLACPVGQCLFITIQIVSVFIFNANFIWCPKLLDGKSATWDSCRIGNPPYCAT